VRAIFSPPWDALSRLACPPPAVASCPINILRSPTRGWIWASKRPPSRSLRPPEWCFPDHHKILKSHEFGESRVLPLPAFCACLNTLDRCQANLEHRSQSRPDSGLGSSHFPCDCLYNQLSCSLLARQRHSVQQSLLDTVDPQQTVGPQQRAADMEHSNWHMCVRAARPSGRARRGAGAGCSAIKYQFLRNKECWV